MDWRNEEYYNQLLRDLEEVFRRQQLDVIRIICRRLRAVGELNSASQRQLIQLAKWQRADLKEIQQVIKKYSKLASSEIDNIFDQTAKDSKAYADVLAEQAAGVVYESNFELMAKAAAKTYKDMVLNMSDTYAFKTHFGVLPIRQTYINAVNKAVAAVSTGTTDYNTAIRQTVRELADSGLRNIYADGEVIPARVRWLNEAGEAYYTRRVDSSVRMNVLEGARRINQEILNDAGEKYATGYEISAHDRPAPDHAELQGKQYTRAAYEQLNASLARPIGTLNCMHIAFPIIYGVSKPAYTAEQLEQFKVNAGKQYRYKGKVFNGYECTQEQRKYETAIRRAKDRANAFEAAGDKANATRERRRVRELGREYRQFSEAVGLSVKLDRARVEGYNKPIIVKNAAGQEIRVVRHTSAKGESNSITQTVAINNAINRNFYDETGRWITQITNNDHGNRKKHPYGKHGEHAHDIIWKDGKIVGRPTRELTEAERRENEDIL